MTRTSPPSWSPTAGPPPRPTGRPGHNWPKFSASTRTGSPTRPGHINPARMCPQPTRLLVGLAATGALAEAAGSAAPGVWALVTPGGPAPALRIGLQPYGVLPATVPARWTPAIGRGRRAVALLARWASTHTAPVDVDPANPPAALPAARHVTPGDESALLDLLTESANSIAWSDGATTYAGLDGLVGPAEGAQVHWRLPQRARLRGPGRPSRPRPNPARRPAGPDRADRQTIRGRQRHRGHRCRPDYPSRRRTGRRRTRAAGRRVDQPSRRPVPPGRCLDHRRGRRTARHPAGHGRPRRHRRRSAPTATSPTSHHGPAPAATGTSTPHPSGRRQPRPCCARAISGSAGPPGPRRCKRRRRPATRLAPS